ncbi:MAG: DUF2007 domain-containing protein [Chloroflexi bacterium]|nr:DUF2007 domain-containing protein [Chloroflexota bacterium]
MSLRKNDKSSDGPRWIAAYITHNLQEAHILLGKLRAHEIPAMIHQEAGATALGITLGNLGEIKILVAPADYDQAVALLRTDFDDQLEASNDKVQLIWQDDGDGVEYYVEDDEE